MKWAENFLEDLGRKKNDSIEKKLKNNIVKNVYCKENVLNFPHSCYYQQVSADLHVFVS